MGSIANSKLAKYDYSLIPIIEKEFNKIKKGRYMDLIKNELPK